MRQGKGNGEPGKTVEDEGKLSQTAVDLESEEKLNLEMEMEELPWEEPTEGNRAQYSNQVRWHTSWPW